MFRFSYLFIISCALLVSSCQHDTEAQEASASKKYNRDSAASYNTQLGLAYLKQGDRPRAKKKLLMALKQAPEAPNVNASMAYFLEKSGDYKEAEMYYKKAITLSSNSGAQLNNFGTYLCRRGKYREAETYFLQAVQDMQYEHTSGAYENAGFCVKEIPDLPKAISYFDKALEQDPSRTQSLYEIVKIEVSQGKSEQALTYLEKYPNVLQNNRTLLTLAVELARKIGKTDLQVKYQTLLAQLTFPRNPE